MVNGHLVRHQPPLLQGVFVRTPRFRFQGGPGIEYLVRTRRSPGVPPLQSLESLRDEAFGARRARWGALVESLSGRGFLELSS